MTDRPTFKDHDYFMKDKTDYTSRKVFEEHVRHTNDQTRLLRDNTKELQAQTEVLHQEMRDYHGELDDVIEGNLIQTKVDERVEQKYNDLDQAYNTQLNRLTQKLTRTNDKIGKIGSGKPSGAFPNVGDLERAYPNGDGGNIYVVSEDNHWYYWNGSAWIAGGLYNATVSDEFPATNLIVNGNFSKGTVNWGSQFTTITAANNVLTATATGQLPFARVFSHTGNRNIKGVTGKKIYARSLQRINDDSCVSMNFVLQNTTVKYDTFKMVNNPENSKWYDMSAIITLPQSVDGIDVGVAFHADYASKEIALGKTMNIKDVIVIDLTETFGSGNEPNKEEMDNILSHYSNKWFDGTTSPFVKLKYVYNKINTLTLPTVDTDTIKYNSKLWGLTGLKYCAHRGYSGIAPENSIPSFELAGENGFWSIEIDLGLTSDNKIIIMHDSTVDRTTNGTGLVRNLTLAQIKEFNIDTGANIGLYPNLKVPTLEEYLTVCRKWRAVPNIHIDQFAVDGVGVEYNLLYQTLVNYGFEKTAIVSASGLNRLRAMRALSKDLHLLYFTGFLSVREINKALEIENCSIGYNYLNGDLVQSAVNYAHQKGIHVNGFTINNATLRDDILVKGVDLITTDSLLPPKHQN